MQSMRHNQDAFAGSVPYPQKQAVRMQAMQPRQNISLQCLRHWRIVKGLLQARLAVYRVLSRSSMVAIGQMGVASQG
jgi:hypothetical protein